MVLGSLIVPVSLVATPPNGSINKIDTLKVKMEELTQTIDKILKDSERVREISRQYKQVADDHLNVVTSFTKQKGECLTLQEEYRRQQERRTLDNRVIIRQNQSLVTCYRTLETLIYSFDAMNEEFFKLKQSIDILNDMSESDIARIKSLEGQVETIGTMIRMEQSKVTLEKEDVEKVINSL
jgi:hypothetical protein